MLTIAAAEIDAFVAHARRCLPNEACGLLVGNDKSSAVHRIVPVTNAAASPTRFALDGREMLDAELAAEREGRLVVGVIHSHPTGETELSRVDLDDAAGYDPFGVFVHMVVALADIAEVEAYRIVDGAAVREPVDVITG